MATKRKTSKPAKAPAPRKVSQDTSNAIADRAKALTASQQRGRDMAAQISDQLKQIAEQQDFAFKALSAAVADIAARVVQMDAALAKIVATEPKARRAKADKAQPLGPELTNTSENANLRAPAKQQTEQEMVQTGLAGLKSTSVAPTHADLRAALTAYASAKGLDEARSVMANSGYASVSSVPVDAIPAILASLTL